MQEAKKIHKGELSKR